MKRFVRWADAMAKVPKSSLSKVEEVQCAVRCLVTGDGR